MSYPWTTAQIAAIGRLADYNGNAYNATTNPKGLAQGGHRTNFAPSLNDTSAAAGAIKDAADYAGAKADAAAASEANALAYAAKMSGTSSTAVAIGAGSKTFTTQAGKFFDPGRTLRIVSASNPNTAYMIGKVTAYSGTALTVSVLVFVGSGSPSDWVILVDGELGPSGTVSVVPATSLAPDQLPTVLNSGTSTAAILAFGIPRGMPAGLFFKWSTNTAATDPTTGKVKVGSASLTTAAALYISETDANAVAQSAVIASWDDSTNPTRGQIRIEDIAAPANFVVFNVTGDLVDNGPWNTLPIAYVDKGGTLADGASVRLEYRATGNIGTPGLPGLDGKAATLTFRTISTLPAGSLATFTNVGTTNAAVVDVGIPRGDKGDTGPVVAIRYNFDTTITDSDPGNGLIRFNSATISSVTQIFIDNVEVLAGVLMTAWIDAFGTSTNPSSKGALTIKDVNDPTKQVIFRITGSTIVDAGMGYRKVPVQYVSGNGGFTTGANLGIVFAKSGDKGADGGGAGDVVGPSTATDGNFALFDGTTGKLLKVGGVPGALATKSNVGDAEFNAAGGQQLSIGKGGTGSTTASTARDSLGLTIGSNVQAYSAKLAAIDSLTWAPNTAPYYTGTATLGAYSLTAFGRSLGGAADSGAAQTLLQLRPGVEVQAFNANLAALAGLTGAADKIPYFTGAGALALADFSSFTRSLTSQTSAGAWRTTLGLGSAALANTGAAAGNVPVLDTNGYLSAAVQPQITGGDITAPAGSAVHTLAATTVSAGNYTGLHSITVNGQGRLTAAANVALTGDITTTAGSLATTIANGVVTYTKLASAALATAASDVWSNVASKVATVQGLWSAFFPVSWGSISGTYTPSLSAFLNATATVSASLTLANPTNVKGGEAGEILFTMGAAGLTISYGTAWKSAGPLPTAPTTSGAQCVLSYRVFDASNIVFTLTTLGA